MNLTDIENINISINLKLKDHFVISDLLCYIELMYDKPYTELDVSDVKFAITCFLEDSDYSTSVRQALLNFIKYLSINA